MTLLSFFLGCVVGSFLNVVIRRGIRGESLFGRSHCESCQKTLTALELIPVVSFLLQRGRCRSCGAPLSYEYPFVEFATGISFLIAAFLFLPENIFLFNLSILFPFLLVLVGLSASIVIFVVDLKEKIIPDQPFYILLVVGLVATLVRSFESMSPVHFSWSTFGSDVGAALFFTLLFASLWFFSKGTWMGFGDVKLILATSLVMGYPTSLAAFLFSFWLGGIIGGVFLLFQRASLKSQIPFGPFILAGSAVAYGTSAYFFGETRFLEGLREIYYFFKFGV